MAESLLKHNNRDFWSEIRRLSSCNKQCPSSIDGVSEPTAIAGLFQKKFSDLYNSVPYNDKEMGDLHDRIDGNIHDHFQQIKGTMPSSNDLAKLINKLKSGKADGFHGLQSDCYKWN